MMNIKFKKLDPRAVAPERAHATDAGFDLTATKITTEINECGQLILVYHTDIAVEIPEGYCGFLMPRSSIFKKSLALTNSVGVIDSGYRGEIMAKFRSTTDVVPAVYKDGEKFAQLLIIPIPEVSFEETLELSNSDRGTGGYGSTDVVTDSQSAPTGPAGSTEDKGEPTIQQAANSGSGEAQNSLEQAQ
jgi:dUTP pyrophosphatase